MRKKLLLSIAILLTATSLRADRIIIRTIDNLPAFNSGIGTSRPMAIVSDGLDEEDCTIGGGSDIHICVSDGTGYYALAWAGSGGGGGLESTDIDTCAELAAIWSDETGTCGGPVLSAGPAFTGDPTVGGSSICLENGTNCPSVLSSGTGYVMAGGTRATASTSATEYFTITGIDTDPDTLPANHQVSLVASTPARLDCRSNSALVGADTYDYCVYNVGTATATDWCCQAAAGAENCNDTSGSTLPNGLYVIRVVPANTPVSSLHNCTITF